MVTGDRAVFDFRGSDPAARGPVNTTPFIAAASVAYVVRAVLGPEIASNDGLLRSLEVLTEPGSLLDPGPAAPLVAGNHETSQRIVDALLRALAQAVPERVVAGGMGSSGLALFSIGDDFLYETHAGGSGASAERDGDAAVRIHMSNVMNTPTEVIEGEYPFVIEEHGLRPGSAGGGRRRGGLGQTRAYRVLGDEITLTTMFERRVIPHALWRLPHAAEHPALGDDVARTRDYFLAASPRRCSSTCRTSLAVSRHMLLSAAVS